MTKSKARHTFPLLYLFLNHPFTYFLCHSPRGLMYTKSPLCNTSSVTLLGRLLLFNAKPEAPQAILGRQTTLGSPSRRQLHPHSGLAHPRRGRARRERRCPHTRRATRPRPPTPGRAPQPPASSTPHSLKTFWQYQALPPHPSPAWARVGGALGRRACGAPSGEGGSRGRGPLTSSGRRRRSCSRRG